MLKTVTLVVDILTLSLGHQLVFFLPHVEMYIRYWKKMRNLFIFNILMCNCVSLIVDKMHRKRDEGLI